MNSNKDQNKQIDHQVDIQKILAISYCILNAIIFCFHFFAAKIVLKAVPTMVFAASRGVIGGLILLIIFRKQVMANLNYKSIKNLVIIGFLGFFINQICFMYGLKQSSAINAAIIINTIPIATALMAILFGLEIFSWKKMSGIFIGFSLVIYLALLKNSGKVSSHFVGDFFIFLNVLSFCLAMTIAKKIMVQDFPHVVLSGGMTFIGGVMLYVFSFWDTTPLITWTFESWGNFGIMFFEIILSTSLTYLLTFKSLEILAPSQTMIFIYFQPPITAVIAYFLYGIVPSWILIPVFFGIMIAGYLVIAKSKRKNST